MKIIKIESKYCPDCKIMELVLREIEKEHPWLEVQNIDIEESPEIVEKYNVLSLPTFIFFSKENKE